MFSSVNPPSAEQSAALAAGLVLAGQTLEPPRFLETGWQSGDVFGPEDDPDRIRETWIAPEFVWSKDPVAQRSKTSVRDLQLPGRMSLKSFARVVTGVLDEEDCAEIVRRANEKGFTPALLSQDGGRQLLSTTARDGFRVVVDCPELTDWILQVLRPHLPERLGGEATDEARLVGLNERCRFLCYVPGQTFAPHVDANLRHPSGSLSRVTAQIYLHDVEAKSGGATTFLFGGDVALPCQPRAGSVLLFKQDLLHAGSLLSSGLKYTFRTEAMYEDIADTHPERP